MTSLPYQLARRSNPKRLLAALGACVGAFAVFGFIQAHGASWDLQAFNLQDSDLDARLSMPASFTSILLACAAILALSLSKVDKRSRSRRWQRAGWLIAVLAIEELLGIHKWLQDRSVPWAVCYLPLVLIAAALLFDALRILANQPRTQAVFGMGIVVWLMGGALDGSTGALLRDFGGIEILEMAAAAMFLVALLARCQYLARAYHPIDEVGSRPALDEIARVVIGRIDFRKLAIGLGIATAAFAIQYVLLHKGNYHHAERLAILDLNNDQTLWDTFQASVLAITGGLAMLTARLCLTSPGTRRWWQALWPLLLFLGAEQVVAIHSRFRT